jgi:hypothetical protein
MALNTFTGVGNWENASNWSLGVPAAGQSIKISGSCTINEFETLGYTDLTVDTGALLLSSNTGTTLLEVNGSVVLNGQIGKINDQQLQLVIANTSSATLSSTNNILNNISLTAAGTTLNLASNIVVASLVLMNGILDVTPANYQITTSYFEIYPGTSFNPQNGTIVFVGNASLIVSTSSNLSFWNLTVAPLSNLTIYGDDTPLIGNTLNHAEEIIYKSVFASWANQIWYQNFNRAHLTLTSNFLDRRTYDNTFTTQLIIDSSFINSNIQIDGNNIFSRSDHALTGSFANTFTTDSTDTFNRTNLIITESYLDLVDKRTYTNTFNTTSLNIATSYNESGTTDNTNNFDAANLSIAASFTDSNTTNSVDVINGNSFIAVSFTDSNTTSSMDVINASLVASASFVNSYTVVYTNIFNTAQGVLTGSYLDRRTYTNSFDTALLSLAGSFVNSNITRSNNNFLASSNLVAIDSFAVVNITSSADIFNRANLIVTDSFTNNNSRTYTNTFNHTNLVVASNTFHIDEPVRNYTNTFNPATLTITGTLLDIYHRVSVYVFISGSFTDSNATNNIDAFNTTDLVIGSSFVKVYTSNPTSSTNTNTFNAVDLTMTGVFTNGTKINWTDTFDPSNTVVSSSFVNSYSTDWLDDFDSLS